jgi:excisionase family DNA binding protein
MQHDEVLKVDEIAKQFRVSPMTVRRWIRQGDLPRLNLPGRSIRCYRSDVVRLRETRAGS